MDASEPMTFEEVRRAWRSKVLAGTVIVAMTLAMAGCGGGGGPPSPSPSLPGWQCESSFQVGDVAAHSQKGLAIDDTTFLSCPDNLPQVWPNANNAPVASIRLFKSWDPNWPVDKRDQAWKAVVSFAKKNNAKVLVGTSISCSETDDDADWKNTLTLLKLLGPKYIMGVAVGNELELLQYKDKKVVPESCVQNVWEGGYLLKKFHERVADLDKLGGEFQNVPVTSVFGEAIFGGSPFWNIPQAMVLDFFQKAVAKYGTRFVYSLNVYPYFDPGNALDPGSTDKCTRALNRSLCFTDPGACSFIGGVQSMRSRMNEVSKQNDVLWITETGWSAPKSSTLSGAMVNCPEFSSSDSFQQFYTGFLSWDLQVEGARGADHVFYFTVHDSSNFGLEEHFGLIKSCGDKQCKLQNQGPTPRPTPPTPNAACDVNPKCKAAHLQGNCCPTDTGSYLGCCPPDAGLLRTHANTTEHHTDAGLVV